MDVQLLVKSKSGQAPQDYVFSLQGRVILGRSPESPIPLEGPAISREHLVLELVGESVYATDLSNNGTWINGKRLRREERTQLENGDSMELPEYQISFRIKGADTRPVESQPVPIAPEITRPDPAPANPKSLTPPQPVKGKPLEIPSRSFSLLDMWILFLAVMVLGLIAYYAFLMP